MLILIKCANLAGGFMPVYGLGVVIGKDIVSKGHLIVYQNVTLGEGNGKPARYNEDGKIVECHYF